MYTQNIDGLERLTGIPEERLIEAHGGFSTASCIKCFKKHDPDKTREMILNGDIVYCERSLCKGLVKPDIVFFGEALPDRFWLHDIDTAIADFLIVMGTSLEVYPFASVADAVWHDIPRLLLNRNVVGSFGLREQDAVITGDIIESIKSLALALDWMDDLEKLVKDYETKITNKTINSINFSGTTVPKTTVCEEHRVYELRNPPNETIQYYINELETFTPHLIKYAFITWHVLKHSSCQLV
ncbi:hypothetical protein L9F63_026012, partial [Diploptera punctata]